MTYPKNIILNFHGVKSVDEMHDVFARAFRFPIYYGKNRDAFWDCITEIEESTIIRVSGLSVLSEELQEFANAYLMLLNEYGAQHYSPEIVIKHEK